MSNKQSSIDYLISQLKISTYWNDLITELELMECGHIDIIKQAKAMHKEEVTQAHTTGYIIGGGNGELYEPEKYYNETFEGNHE